MHKHDMDDVLHGPVMVVTDVSKDTVREETHGAHGWACKRESEEERAAQAGRGAAERVQRIERSGAHCWCYCWWLARAAGRPCRRRRKAARAGAEFVGCSLNYCAAASQGQRPGARPPAMAAA